MHIYLAAAEVSLAGDAKKCHDSDLQMQKKSKDTKVLAKYQQFIHAECTAAIKA